MLLPHVNLAKHRALAMTIAAEYEWSEEREQSLRPLFNNHGQPSPLSFLAVTYYRSRDAGRTPHYLSASIWCPEEENSPFVVNVRYLVLAESVADYDRPPAGMRREAEFAPRFFALGEASEVRWSVEFRFRQRNADDLWFPLPTRVTDAEQGLFEIRGVRGAKLVDEDRPETEYGFTIDRPTGKDVYLDVNFESSGAIDRRMPEQILKRANQIAASLVRDTERTKSDAD